MVIRKATPDDAPAIAAVHVASWQGAYRGQLPDDVLDGQSVERRTAQWLQMLATPGQMTFVAEENGGRITAFVLANAARDEDAGEKTAEVFAIYAAPDAWGAGAGRALMATAVDRLREAGYREAVLWVLDSNARARRFYELAGWAPDGTVKDDVIAGVPVTEVRYRRTL